MHKLDRNNNNMCLYAFRETIKLIISISCAAFFLNTFRFSSILSNEKKKGREKCCNWFAFAFGNAFEM